MEFIFHLTTILTLNFTSGNSLAKCLGTLLKCTNYLIGHFTRIFKENNK